jgi:hypothetical protein
MLGTLIYISGKTGKIVKKIPCREKSGNLLKRKISGKNQGDQKVFCKGKYFSIYNFVINQYWGQFNIISCKF